MSGLGTLINVIGIIAGGLAGLLFGNRMKDRVQNTLMTTTGVCVLFLVFSASAERLKKCSV